MSALDALHRARLAWERTQPQLAFDPHTMYPDARALERRPPTSPLSGRRSRARVQKPTDGKPRRAGIRSEVSARPDDRETGGSPAPSQPHEEE